MPGLGTKTRYVRPDATLQSAIRPDRPAHGRLHPLTSASFPAGVAACAARHTSACSFGVFPTGTQVWSGQGPVLHELTHTWLQVQDGPGQVAARRRGGAPNLASNAAGCPGPLALTQAAAAGGPGRGSPSRSRRPGGPAVALLMPPCSVTVRDTSHRRPHPRRSQEIRPHSRHRQPSTSCGRRQFRRWVRAVPAGPGSGVVPLPSRVAGPIGAVLGQKLLERGLSLGSHHSGHRHRGDGAEGSPARRRQPARAEVLGSPHPWRRGWRGRTRTPQCGAPRDVLGRGLAASRTFPGLCPPPKAAFPFRHATALSHCPWACSWGPSRGTSDCRLVPRRSQAR